MRFSCAIEILSCFILLLSLLTTHKFRGSPGEAKI